MIKLFGLLIMVTGMITFYYAIDLESRQKKLSKMNMFVNSYSGLFLFIKVLSIALIMMGAIFIYSLKKKKLLI